MLMGEDDSTMRAFVMVFMVGRTLASTSAAGFAPVSASAHFATSSQSTKMPVKPLTPLMVAVNTRKPVRRPTSSMPTTPPRHGR